METIDLTASSTGVELVGKVQVVGAVRRPTKHSTEDDPHYWHAVKFRGADGDGDVLMGFCEQDVASEAAAKLSKAGAPFTAEAVVRLTESNRSTTINVESLT